MDRGYSLTRLVEAVLPGYLPVYIFAIDTLGYDLTHLVSLGAALWLFITICQLCWVVMYGLVERYYMSEISVASTDEVYDHLMAFFLKEVKMDPRRTRIETVCQTSDSEYREAQKSLWSAADGSITLLNFSNIYGTQEPRYTPAIGSHGFWYNKKYFLLQRDEQTLLDMPGMTTSHIEKQILRLSCFGRSALPLKRLVAKATALYYHKDRSMTIIRCPPPKDSRTFGPRWIRAAERLSRPMETVVLDKSEKLKVVLDMNSYLHPLTAEWYSQRGIPYRRGYLFCGPPGTGKTSLAFALAGLFGLDIYVMSLLDQTLTEDELAALFHNLPPKCIALLEDIDTAGVHRDPAVNVPLADRQAYQSVEANPKGITLSSLLNVIDGVASHEGRILLMTANCPENLDAALTRPGRVDITISFSNATKQQARELFARMYSDDSQLEKESENDTNLKYLALTFAGKLPDKEFSPAELQGFLLTRKTDPKQAVEDIEEWVREMRENRKASA